MEVEECKISVWVCREEKLVAGVTRRTSCADVVRVLLEDRSSPALAGSAQSYCIVEKWRGFERVLPNRTKILRLWTAWGHEQDNVRFVLVRSDASLPGIGPRSAEARVVPSKESRCADNKCDPATPVAVATTAGEEISQEKRRRVVRKAFRKLEKINRRKEETCAEEYAERMETLVHLVLSQDHTIWQQTQRIRELDGEIERHEARVHTDRMRRHGINYVQDTYLVDAGDSASASAKLDADAMARCDQVIRVQEQLTEHHALLERLTGEIQEELDRRWTTWQREGDEEEAQEVAPVETPASEKDVRLEEERIRTQLDTSSYIGLRLNTDLEAVQSELEASLEVWEAKERELRDLLEKMDSCDGCGEDAGEGDAAFTDDVQPPPPPPSSVEQSDCWVERARGLSKSNPSGNDDDSDTGLSSMHSQDSDNAAVCESLV